MAGLCSYHVISEDESWPRTNKIMCDFFHRGVPIPRMNKADRVADPDYWPGTLATEAVLDA